VSVKGLICFVVVAFSVEDCGVHPGAGREEDWFRLGGPYLVYAVCPNVNRSVQVSEMYSMQIGTDISNCGNGARDPKTPPVSILRSPEPR
jgi:hypothetical protein